MASLITFLFSIHTWYDLWWCLLDYCRRETSNVSWFWPSSSVAETSHANAQRLRNSKQRKHKKGLSGMILCGFPWPWRYPKSLVYWKIPSISGWWLGVALWRNGDHHILWTILGRWRNERFQQGLQDPDLRICGHPFLPITMLILCSMYVVFFQIPTWLTSWRSPW